MIRDECTKTVNRTKFTQTKTTKNRRRKVEEKGTNGEVCKRKTTQGYKWKKIQEEKGTKGNRYKSTSQQGTSVKGYRGNRYKGVKWKRVQGTTGARGNR